VVLATPYDETLRHGEDIPVFAIILATHPCLTIDLPLAKIYKHDDSMRHNVITAQRSKQRLPAVLFDNPALPANLLRYRREFTGRCALSLFRSCFRAGEFNAALSAWRQALIAMPTMALAPKILFKLATIQSRRWFGKHTIVNQIR
jgi:hypothetical protein